MVTPAYERAISTVKNIKKFFVGKISFSFRIVNWRFL